MLDRAWRLAYGTTTYEWGGIDPADPFRRNVGRVMIRGLDVSETELTSEDSPRPRGDGIRFGQDYRQGRTYTFTLGVRARTSLEAETLMAAAERAWRGDGMRTTAGATATLTTMVGGQERTVFGRPRKFQPNYDLLPGGEMTALATFDTADDLWFGAEKSVRVDLRAVPVGGFTFPVTFPLVMSQPTTKAGVLNVGGTVRTPVQVDIHGPIGNPTVTRLGGGWQLRLDGAVGSGRIVTLDGRERSAVDQTGASWAGAVSRSSRLSQLVLEPGQQQQLALTGTDPTGSAYLVARWRDAYAARR